MLNEDTFNSTIIRCANDYIMAYDEWSWQYALDHMEATNVEVEKIVFKPITNQIRIILKYTYKAFNISECSVAFLRRLWKIENLQLRSAIKQYISGSSLKNKLSDVEDPDSSWLIAVLLGSKDD